MGFLARQSMGFLALFGITYVGDNKTNACKGINGNLAANMFIVSPVISSAISVPANETKSGSVNCAKSGYASLGIVGMRGVGVSVGIYYIDGNTLNFNLKNYYSYARTESVTFFVLYRKL